MTLFLVFILDILHIHAYILGTLYFWYLISNLGNVQLPRITSIV